MQVVMEQDIGSHEPTPHGQIGLSTVFRFTEHVPSRGFEFRKRILHVGAAIGAHLIDHDEIYYVISGEGAVFCGSAQHPVATGAAVYFHAGETVGIAQQGDADLVIIVAYPPTHPSPKS